MPRLPLPIGIMGAGHPGSTLLHTLLVDQTRVSGVGEAQRISIEPPEDWIDAS